ncbi:MAG: hypothetical protein R3E90_09985 [Marinicella sp.]
MNADKIIIVFIVILVLYAHWWIFQWVKFKVDEAVIHNQLLKSGDMDEMTVATVALKTGINQHRVSKVCSKSQLEVLKALISS